MHYARWLKYGDPLVVIASEGIRSPCSVIDCGKPAKARGWCGMHYARWHQYGNPLTVFKPKGIRSICTLVDCEAVVEGHGYCHKHYRRWRKHGDPTITKRRQDHRQQKEGYILLYRPDHPDARADGYILEHRVVMSEALGRPLLPTEIVHHLDGDRAHNRRENLTLLTRTMHPTGHCNVKCPACGHHFTT